jgi:hypothetical protein
MHLLCFLTLKGLVSWCAVLFLIIGFLGYLVVIFLAVSGISKRLHTLVFSETAYNIGLPTCALTALALVVSLETFVASPSAIKVEMIGVTLEGAASPVILWVVTYLALVVSMRALRKPES